MCGRYSLDAPGRALAELLQLPSQPALPLRYNIAPMQSVPVARLAADGVRELVLAQWGLVPHWAKDPAIGNQLINARSETVAEKPSFRDAFRKRRCLIPADGFFEWAGAKGTKRQPFHFRLSDGLPFAFAGLWERWHGQDGEMLGTCCLLTTAANEVVRPIHDRMPVLLGPGDFGEWLDPEGKAAGLKALLRPYAGGDLEAVAVSTWVNSARHEGPRCLRPADAGPPGLWDAPG
jgi:putative SOS response-associated peptidase YedK